MAIKTEQEHLIEIGEGFLIQDLVSPTRAVRSIVVGVRPIGELSQIIDIRTFRGRQFAFNTGNILGLGIYTDRTGERYNYFRGEEVDPDVLRKFSIEHIVEGMEVGFLPRPLGIAIKVR